MYGVGMETTTEIKRLHAEWQESVRRGRPDRFAKQKEYLAAVR